MSPRATLTGLLSAPLLFSATSLSGYVLPSAFLHTRRSRCLSSSHRTHKSGRVSFVSNISPIDDGSFDNRCNNGRNIFFHYAKLSSNLFAIGQDSDDPSYGNFNATHPLGQDENAALHINYDEECYDLCDTDTEGLPFLQNDSILEHNPENQIDKQIQEKKQRPTSRGRQLLELQWSINLASEDCDLEDILSCSEPCDVCRGKGVTVCQFCHGLGYVEFGNQEDGTIGGRLVKNNGGFTSCECPVCDENGDQVCQKCNGSGWIARWRLNGNGGDLKNLHP